jgi:uncharacterized protein YndB with AHSA1/START domain
MKPATGDDSIVQEITITAPADRIFEALTDPRQLVQWWGVNGRFQVTHAESDLRPGGQWLMRGIGMNDRPFIVRGAYRKIDRPRALVFTWLPDWLGDTSETLVRIDLDEVGGMTTVRLTHSDLLADSSRVSHQGWPQLLDRLRAHTERQ